MFVLLLVGFDSGSFIVIGGSLFKVVVKTVVVIVFIIGFGCVVL